MKLSIIKQRFLLLLLLLSTCHVKANAQSVSGYENSVSDSFQHAKNVNDQNSDANSFNPGNKNATTAVYLTVLPFQGKIALLSWISSDNNTIPGTYYVERFDPAGLVVLKQLPYDTILAYYDTISYPYCDSAANIKYQIRFISASDTIISLVETVLLFDQTSPAEVQNLSVTINQTRLPVLTWTPVSGDDILEFRIQRYNGYSWDKIATVPDNSNSYSDQNAKYPCDSSYKYVVSTIDRCGISSEQLIYEDFAVQTIKLEPSKPGQCDKFSNLVWSSYNNMPGGGPGGYKIFRNDQSATIEIQDTQATTFVDNFDFKNGITYTYSVIAYSKDGLYTSSSCLMGWTYKAAILPDTVYITQVSVENNKDIRIGYHLYPAGSVIELILERSDDDGANFHAVDTLSVSGSGVPQDYYFIDSLVQVHQQSYSYRLVAIDNCGYPTPSSNTSRSIWLQCSTSETENMLNWNKYEYWLKGVEGYDVYRILNKDPSTVIFIANVDPNTVTYLEPLANYDNTKAVCYWVQGTENPGNYLNNPVSISNACCIIKEPILFMPNAFQPDGKNNLFRPVPEFLYVDVQSFKMTVFSRWGQQLFETTDINKGWNGNINGHDGPVGQYVYIVKYKSLEGKDYTKRGTVFLVR